MKKISDDSYASADSKSTENFNFEQEEIKMTNGFLKHSLSHLGYNSYDAIADIVDNSIEPNLNTSTVKILVNHKGNKITDIVIADDGDGMTMETLKNALSFASSNKDAKYNLGLYGTGLKTASLSIGYRLEILSKYVGTDEINYAYFDLTDVDPNAAPIKFFGSATPELVDYFNSFGFTKGTVVKISEIHHLCNNDFYSFTETLRKRLGTKNYRFIRDAEIDFILNDEPINAISPIGLNAVSPIKISPNGFGFDYKGLRIDLDVYWFKRTTEKKKEGYVTRQPSNSGFYIYRNNRLVGQGLSLGCLGKTSKDTWYNGTRIEMSINGQCDDIFNVSLTKIINESTDIEQGFLDKLKETVAPYLADSKIREQEYTPKPEISEDTEKALADVTKKINDNKLLNVTRPSKPKNKNPKKQQNPNPHKSPKTNFKNNDWFGGYRFEERSEFDPIYKTLIEEGLVYCVINSNHPFYKYFLAECDKDTKQAIAIYFACQYKGLKDCGYYNDESIAEAIDELMLRTSEAFRILYR